MNSNIGKLLKDLRYNKGLTLKDLAQMSGLSISFLSQVENSKSSITLQSLSKISDALEVSRSYFFPESEPPKSLVRKNTRGNLNFNQSNFIYQSLSNNIQNSSFEQMLVVFLPNNEKVTSSTHKGHEFVYVLEGTLSLVQSENEYDLEPGDSFHMDSTTPHTWYNRTNEAVKLLYVYSTSPSSFH